MIIIMIIVILNILTKFKFYWVSTYPANATQRCCAVDRRARALPGESVLNREATAGLGAEGVSALNSGVSKGNISISMVYKHRIFDNFVQDNISKGGPLRDAIRSGRRVGHRGS